MSTPSWNEIYRMHRKTAAEMRRDMELVRLAYRDPVASGGKQTTLEHWIGGALVAAGVVCLMVAIFIFTRS